MLCAGAYHHLWKAANRPRLSLGLGQNQLGRISLKKSAAGWFDANRKQVTATIEGARESLGEASSGWQGLE